MFVVRRVYPPAAAIIFYYNVMKDPYRFIKRPENLQLLELVVWLQINLIKTFAKFKISKQLWWWKFWNLSVTLTYRKYMLISFSSSWKVALWFIVGTKPQAARTGSLSSPMEHFIWHSSLSDAVNAFWLGYS